MLVIDGHDVFEIDEECVKKYNVNKECEIVKRLMAVDEKNEEKEKVRKL